jgi:hypothetical protein
MPDPVAARDDKCEKPGRERKITMNRYDAEMSKLFAVERQLLNAAVSLRSAEHRLGHGQLGEEIREILCSLEGTMELTKRVKRIMLNEWRLAEAKQDAA